MMALTPLVLLTDCLGRQRQRLPPDLGFTSCRDLAQSLVLERVQGEV